MGIFGGPSSSSPQDRIDIDDLKGRVTQLEATVARLQAQLVHAATAAAAAASAPAGSVAAAAPPQEADWMSEVRVLKAQGKMIHAIKLYRERTHVGLKEAKDAVEGLY